MQVSPSPRLTYRLLSADDKQLLFDLDQDPQVMRHLNHGIPSSWDDINNRFLPRLAKYHNPDKGWGLWGCFLESKFIGWVLIRPAGFFTDKPDFSALEIGWRFVQSSWGKGYATEAAQAVMQQLQLAGNHKYIAVAAIENAASVKVMQRIGLEYLSTGIDEDPAWDGEVVRYFKDFSA
ncbi:GNAT family N-acetyltransferase [Paraferrimonas sp. SM1919]|uniref:GNAT family N-acetyltransferase n=1 Tax=Paraferrimonas sp. SM1919 TaxID=2662263 RepID=UPI0013D6FFD9|nr:GNAT family N-acetyltransferase [Paraferrimonas sp. SM1919]